MSGKNWTRNTRMRVKAIDQMDGRVNKRRDYVCPKCLTSFPTEEEYRNHYRKEHRRMTFITGKEFIEKFQICECGHTRKDHEEEQPHLCCKPERGLTFRCGCKGFDLKKIPEGD